MAGVKSNIAVAVLVMILSYSCTPTGVDQSIEEIFVATPDTISVPDSSRYNDIHVRLVAHLGGSTAFRLERISYSLKDTLFSLAIFTYHKEKSGEQYMSKDVILDSTLVLVLNPPRYGRHYFKVFDREGGFLIDSTIVY